MVVSGNNSLDHCRINCISYVLDVLLSKGMTNILVNTLNMIIRLICYRKKKHIVTFQIKTSTFLQMQNPLKELKSSTFLKVTLQMGREGSFKLTSKLSHFRSKCTIFFECKYSIPNAASIAIMSLLRRSRCLDSSSREENVISFHEKKEKTERIF